MEITKEMLSRKDAVYLTPLGGLGEIGMNMMAIIHRNRAIIVDCGLTFPDSGSLGIDLVLPDIQFLLTHHILIDGIILTHAHEDHIGATAFLIEDLGRPPIYGTPFTLALVEDRLREQGQLSMAKTFKVTPPETFDVGKFRIRTLQVTHSVVDSMGVIIETPVGSIVHSGDFKMDEDPLDGKKIDQAILEQIGDQGALLLMSDSTNVERPGWSKPEAEVAKGIETLFQTIKTGKIIVGVFASNIHRIQQILSAAERAGRKAAFLGRSMHSNVEVARQLGYLKFDPSLIIQASDVDSMNASEVVIIATGTQAEPRSALYRMSLNDHPDIRLLPGDTVILSSRHIPGNEKNISHLINNLYRRGAEVIDGSHANVHASGHAHVEEQKTLIRWVKPKFFLPVHGEYRMLIKHLRVAEEVLPGLKGVVAENGDLLELTKDSLRKVGRFPSGKVFLDEGASDLHEELLRDRRQLANTGLVVVSLLLDREAGLILDGPNFDIRGVSEVDRDSLKETVLKHLQELSREARGDEVEVEEELRRVTRRFFRKVNGVKPVVIPLVYEV